ncbi:MAG: hypothetical protein IPL37_00005 [Austwickia sp.]|nr:hypothetical protein [Austwickia sp.]
MVDYRVSVEVVAHVATKMHRRIVGGRKTRALPMTDLNARIDRALTLVQILCALVVTVLIIAAAWLQTWRSR